jgi:regulator of sigma E protease
MTIVVALLGFIGLIITHELGHMLTAKALGVRVPEFSVGFGPALFKKKLGKTVYSFRIILLGGFAKMAGMEGVAGVEEVKEEDRGPDTYLAKPPWRRALIIVAGPFANLLAAVFILAGIYMIGVPTGVSTKVYSVEPGSMAAQTGIQPGDKLVSVDGTTVDKWQDFRNALAQKSPGDKVSVGVDRGGEREEFSGTLGSDPRDTSRAVVGVSPEQVYTRYGPFEALWLGAKRTVEIIGLFGSFVGQLVTGDIGLSNAVTSPIGAVSVSSDAVSQGTQSFATLLALISINLAVFNLLPILPLDGGHLFFIAAEKVMGRPVRPETVARIAAFGLALILMLFVFATFTDLSKIFTGQPFIPDQSP